MSEADNIEIRQKLFSPPPRASSSAASRTERPKASSFSRYFRRAWTASILPTIEVMVMAKALRPMVPREDTISSLAPSSAPRVTISSSRAAVWSRPSQGMGRSLNPAPTAAPTATRAR